ncbi:MAG: hypothetical protein J3Q66DRAFT_373772 [Benniella sp.]|nr:MAG: hypothetical protein J3Q66DRAFT_373772 [Benniella sp.]
MVHRKGFLDGYPIDRVLRDHGFSGKEFVMGLYILAIVERILKGPFTPIPGLSDNACVVTGNQFISWTWGRRNGPRSTLPLLILMQVYTPHNCRQHQHNVLHILAIHLPDNIILLVTGGLFTVILTIISVSIGLLKRLEVDTHDVGLNHSLDIEDHPNTPVKMFFRGSSRGRDPSDSCSDPTGVSSNPCTRHK